jgi:hypothetical protein
MSALIAAVNVKLDRSAFLSVIGGKDALDFNLCHFAILCVERLATPTLTGHG